MLKKTLTGIILILALGITSVSAQITIAPIFMFLDEQNPYGQLLVMNSSDKTQEVSVEFPFGYPVTDSEGQIQMVYNDTSRASKYGISEKVRGFPQNFVLAPGQRQVVRLTVRPGQRSDGMYWTRIKTTSVPQAPPVGEATDDERITARITYRFQQVTTLFYKIGDATTGLTINDLSIEKSEEKVLLLADLTRTGNAPYIGTIDLTVTDQNGEVMARRRSSTSIYFDYIQSFSINKSDLPPGSYTATFSFETKRPDIAREDLVQAEPITRSTTFTIK